MHVHMKSVHWMQNNSVCSDLEPLSKALHPLNYKVSCRCCSDINRWSETYLVPVIITRGPPSKAHVSRCCSDALHYSRQPDTRVLHKQRNYIHVNLRSTSVFQMNRLCIAFCSCCTIRGVLRIISTAHQTIQGILDLII